MPWDLPRAFRDWVVWPRNWRGCKSGSDSMRESWVTALLQVSLWLVGASELSTVKWAVLIFSFFGFTPIFMKARSVGESGHGLSRLNSTGKSSGRIEDKDGWFWVIAGLLEEINKYAEWVKAEVVISAPSKGYVTGFFAAKFPGWIRWPWLLLALYLTSWAAMPSEIKRYLS